MENNFDAAKKNNPGLQEWIDQQKTEVIEQINAGHRMDGSTWMENNTEHLSRKLEAYAFYVQSICGGNISLDPYSEYKRFTEFRNNPEFNTENSLADKHILNDIEDTKKWQARMYIREKFSCDLEEYEDIYAVRIRLERENRLSNNFESRKKDSPEFNAWVELQNNTLEDNYIFDEYVIYIANTVRELPQNPYEDYHLFNKYALQNDEFKNRTYIEITEIKRSEAEQYIQNNFSCSLDEYEEQIERQKRPEQWKSFDTAKKNNSGFTAWINKQKDDLSSDIALNTTGTLALEGEDAELLSLKIEAYAFYVHSACGGNTYLNPYAEYKRFTEFRNNPEFNTENSLADKHMLNDIEDTKEWQAGMYIREKFSCDLEEYEEKKKQLNVNKAVKKCVDLDF
ncbi:MAG: hypothetical protein IJD04_06420 [Desulfovibrionaceae bacterium]|nr:hypothetical protein [Desulfovibrionaceae bacterium]